MNVHELLDQVKTRLHEEFGPEVGRRATQIIDGAKVDAEDNTAAPAEGNDRNTFEAAPAEGGNPTA